MRTFFFCYCLMEWRSRCELILKKEVPLSKNLLAIAEREGFERTIIMSNISIMYGLL